jgi:hypothetical protein
MYYIIGVFIDNELKLLSDIFESKIDAESQVKERYLNYKYTIFERSLIKKGRKS